MFPYITINNSLKMPIIGLGTYKLKGFNDCFNVIDVALECGYRLFDTAQVYKNEKDLGNCFGQLLKKYNLTRQDIFITSKTATENHGYEKCLNSVMKSLTDLQTDYIDMMLIHWPSAKGMKNTDERNIELRKQTWLALEKCLENGYVKSIGVSNYTTNHLIDLFQYANVKPSLLQSEYHPLLAQDDLINFCKHNHVLFQAYSSLGTSDINTSKQLLDNEVIRTIANKYSKSPAQILLKWTVQQDLAVIPKSTNASHIRENIEIFDFLISDYDVNEIKKLNQNKHFCWNPDVVI